MTKDGELNNDITLIVTPLILYLFTLSWKLQSKMINGEHVNQNNTFLNPLDSNI